MDSAQISEPQFRGSLSLSRRGALCGHDFRVGGVTVDFFFLTSVLEAIPGKIKVANPVSPSVDMNQRT